MTREDKHHPPGRPVLLSRSAVALLLVILSTRASTDGDSSPPQFAGASSTPSSSDEDAPAVSAREVTRREGGANSTGTTATSTNTVEEERKNDRGQQRQQIQPCGLYLAESSGGMQPLGVYAGVDLPEGAAVGHPEIGIPLVDWFQNNPPGNHGGEPGGDHPHLWPPGTILASFENDFGEQALIPGVGLAGSNNPGVFGNARFDRTSVLTRFGTSTGAGGGVDGEYEDGDGDESMKGTATGTGTLDWRTDPGAGATSEYFNLTMRTMVPLQAGTEIFPHYGSKWFEEIEREADWFPDIILKKHHDEADRIVREYANFVHDQGDAITEENREELWSLIADDVVPDPKIRKLLPRTVKDALRIAKIGSVINQHPGIVKRLDWLQENGQCMDNLVAGPSTITAAGRGAFATRSIPKGSLVAPGPLIRFTRDDMYEYQLDRSGRKTEEIFGQQLLMNYCFAHRDSEVLLYPYSSVTNFINHNGKESNAEIRWSTSTNQEKSLLNLSANELEQVPRYGLMFDFIATRDIAPGEEVFIDYGSDWEDAWRDHLLLWRPPNEEDAYPCASWWNEENSPIRTLEEQESDPYPSSIKVVCTVSTTSLVDASAEEKNLFESYFDETTDLDDILIQSYRSGTEEDEYFCDIIMRFVDDNLEPVYFAHLHVDEEKDPGMYVTNISHVAVFFVDSAYSSAMHMVEAFRYPIGIPDDIFPEAWKDFDDL